VKVITVGNTDFVVERKIDEMSRNPDRDRSKDEDVKLVIFSEGDKGYAPFLSSLAAVSNEGDLSLAVRIFSKTLSVTKDNDIPEPVPPEWLMYLRENEEGEIILFLRITSLDDRTTWLAHYDMIKDIFNFIKYEMSDETNLNISHLTYITSDVSSGKYFIADSEVIVFNYRDEVGDKILSNKGHLINNEFTVYGLAWMFPYLFTAFTDNDAYIVFCSPGQEPINRHGMESLAEFFKETYGLETTEMDKITIDNIATSIEMAELAMRDDNNLFLFGDDDKWDSGGLSA